MKDTENPGDLLKFKELGPDRYILTAKLEPALIAAWQVLQSLEEQRYGKPNFYKDDAKAGTLKYLSKGGEERPCSGIFDVSVRESLERDDEFDLNVLNGNGRGNDDYRAILREAVDTVGVEDETPS